MSDYSSLPEGLPAPIDDGKAAHLKGMPIPRLSLASTDETAIDISTLSGRTIMYAYPLTGVPGEALPPGWDSIPGARGCTPQSCAFRDHFVELRGAGAEHVFGLSTQATPYQQELHTRLHLPFPLLSDSDLRLTLALSLPTFEAGGKTLLKRLTLAIDNGTIVHVFYPVFPPDTHAGEVLAWLRKNPATG